ncbi:peptidogalycan biosysnthesis protein, partial [Acinetobacter baumannii]
DRVVLILARHHGDWVAGALNLLGSDTLYGRNWGCAGDYKFLHFEACYYRAIDFAIKRGLRRVEAGAQGRHKIQRGYLPTETYSA